MTPTVARVADLARVKRLPLEFLRELAVKDVANGVAIEYRLMDGSLAPRQRIRLSPPGEKNRSIWDNQPGAIVPYGLDRLPEAYNAGFIVIVEGESDCWTLWQHGYPALGIPGATMVRTLQPEYLNDEVGKTFIVQEPGDAGKVFVQQLTAKLRDPGFSWKGEIVVFSLGTAKDPSDLHIKDPAGFNATFQGALDSAVGIDSAEPQGWREIFHSFEDFENAPKLTFTIKDFLQNDGATLIGGLSGHGKTLLMLSMVKAMLGPTGTMLWNQFPVTARSVRILYLIPESTITPFKHRLELFGLYDCLRPEDGRLLVHTLSKGPTPCLSDPRILYAAKGGHVFLDTAVRFSTEGDENSAGDNQRGLAMDIFALLSAGARTVVGAHHSPKPFAKENIMRLENVLRGSGDIGAMVTTAWGIKQLDRDKNIIHMENIKPRDFQPPPPFQLIGRPYIDTEGDFRMYRRPGDCGFLQDEQKPERDKGGAPVQAREARAANIELLRQWLCDELSLCSTCLSQKFADIGIKVGDSAIRKYRKEIRL